MILRPAVRLINHRFPLFTRASAFTTTPIATRAISYRVTAMSTENKTDESKATPGKVTDWVKPDSKDGEFHRQVSSFRSHISSSPGSPHPPAKDRYHLFVSYACPWAHRTLIVRKLKHLESIISISVVHWHLGSNGWRFAYPSESVDGKVDGDENVKVAPEPIVGAHYLRDVYFAAEPGYNARYTVPVLWDKVAKTVVSNESSEIIRMLYEEFDELLLEGDSAKGVTYYPKDLRGQIDELNDWIYDQVNNGVYKTGFATTQEAYERNNEILFRALDRIEGILSKGGPYLLGSQLTEADIRLFPTIIRFDPVYVQHFKCCDKMIRYGYPAIHKWLRRLYWENDAFKETTNFEHIKKHYTKSHSQINPYGITPRGPVPDVCEKDW